MRDFRDAKAMAHALRDALKVKAVETTHSECLELIAKAFGYENWNILSAKIEAAALRHGDGRPSSSDGAQDPASKDTLFCSFCGRSQHKMRALIAGPHVYICDECVETCDDILDYGGYRDDEDILSSLKVDEESGDEAYSAAFEQARSKSTEDLASCVELSRKGAERNRDALQYIESRLALPDGETADQDFRFYWLKGKTKAELFAVQQQIQRELKRYEAALHIAVSVLDGRGR
jgi:hypothetical protein